MFSDNMSSDSGSQARLIKAPKKDMASPLNQDMEDLLERALDESDADTDADSIAYI